MAGLESENLWSQSNNSVLPEDMKFNDGHVVSIATYSVLMVVSAAGNLTVLFIILRRRARSRVNHMLMHLAIADLLVTFLMMPLEIGWSSTVSWRAGDALCRVMAFFRVFGLFLSSFVLICISIDRYFAVLKPMKLSDVARRGRYLLAAAWIMSVLCSTPQMFVFHVESHPNVTWYRQCVSYNSFPSKLSEYSYLGFGMLMMYGLPLAVIIFSYTSILGEIYRRSREFSDDRFRRSSLGFLGRARIRTLKMTIIIVVVFFICWTPYYIMCLWWWFDKDSAMKIDFRLQKGLFIFASTNSCMNPIVYGVFNIRARPDRGQVRNHNTLSSTERETATSHVSQWSRRESDLSSQLEETPQGSPRSGRSSLRVFKLRGDRQNNGGKVTPA
ncbi:adipokinetic hormone/corazonin-related peptide receptor variant I-like isoform X4 [Schistocerca gregaria]|uniref:adipokinetic hormone/corazonin-related peptide receptor variant I-like isoform X4 n=1 Tax=Schistocerca gregaria TaxID=7010 RepID=UPI00211F27CF|nr:adipokinetic hormone/corazonin-related peptide receptor variant I-like isoform X4 [Schistocerca gregaria]XP_049827019.1 adipokinetic hormone/corazonin-related peptide receptor variant I-like isoform X4 [Schistocerca gregaria]XP_049864173.1 adipokinetic hormone/corazonin-related peptide receptor variant I-like isoform X4 [Schistocerca gregaria]XP_049864174.1 adipokinetic hormone/corazonin-related peptide receptor variant I-like isoform X4 [Schistocerca gregaria]